MNIKPTPEQVDDWELEAAKYAESQTSEYYEYQQAKNEKFAELAAQWGAAQAQQTTVEEPELPEAVAWMRPSITENGIVYDSAFRDENGMVPPETRVAQGFKPLYTATQMHDHFTAGVRAGAARSQDATFAIDNLAMMFDAYENGVQCYETPEDCGGFLGHAVLLDDDSFHAIANFLDKHRPINAAMEEQKQ